MTWWGDSRLTNLAFWRVRLEIMALELDNQENEFVASTSYLEDVERLRQVVPVWARWCEGSTPNRDR
jgi:hypothetical protein